MSLPELVSAADVAVRGHVISARVEAHPDYPNLSTVLVTVSAESVLKGKTGQTYTFRQFIWDPRDKIDAAGYRKGQEVLLLMNAVNENGLTSPVGMVQGRFRIVTDSKGKKSALNGQDNFGLFQNVTSTAPSAMARLSTATSRAVTNHRAGPIQVAQLEEVIRALAGAAQ
jgi:hypothetical protein